MAYPSNKSQFETQVAVGAGNAGLIGCGFYLAFIGLLWYLSTWAFQYSIMVWFGKDLPTWVDWTAGFFLGEVMPIIWVASLIADSIKDTPIFP